VADEISVIIEEINEEVKNEQMVAFLKKHRNTISAVVGVIVVGIVAYTFWHSNRNKQMEEITNALLGVLSSSGSKSALMDGLIADAPAELKPMLTIIKLGRKLTTLEEVMANSDALMALAEKKGVDIVWKDLATVICASYRMKSNEELIKMLEPLTNVNRPFRFTAMELLAMNYESVENHKKSQEYLEKIVDGKDAPPAMKNRAKLLLNYIRNNLEKK